MKPGEKLPEVLLNGGKILFIKFIYVIIKDSNVIIKDSINFIPMALAKLPKTFDLKELKKGYFPHYFNIAENQNYIGKYLGIQYYGAELMSSKDHEKFIEWHHEQKGFFNLQEELLSYCQSDVDILKKSCLAFRNLFMDFTKTSVDPFTECITIASPCHLVFRRNL